MIAPAFGQTDTAVVCRLWKPISYCHLPDSVKLPDVVYFASVTMTAISCFQLDTIKGLKGLRVTFKGKNISELHLKSNFENIYVVNKISMDTIHPIAILKKQKFENLDEPQYDYCDFQAEDHYFTFIPERKYDLFLLFRNANIGDRLVIEDLIGGLIEK
jgi:hypothetical protein